MFEGCDDFGVAQQARELRDRLSAMSDDEIMHYTTVVNISTPLEIELAYRLHMELLSARTK